MAVDRLPGQVREFSHYLGGLLARLDQNAGWAAVFWQRDSDGMQACLDGREVPPWDVVESLLQDVAAGYGKQVAEQEAERVRPLHAAALAAHDARPGGRDALGDRLHVMLGEQRYAAERQAELGRLLAAATTQEEADTIRLDLAWVQDDHERATARCAELRYRMEELDRMTAGGVVPAAQVARRSPGAQAGAVAEAGPQVGPGAGGAASRGPGDTHTWSADAASRPSGAGARPADGASRPAESAAWTTGDASEAAPRVERGASRGPVSASRAVGDVSRVSGSGRWSSGDGSGLLASGSEAASWGEGGASRGPVSASRAVGDVSRVSGSGRWSSGDGSGPLASASQADLRVDQGAPRAAEGASRAPASGPWATGGASHAPASVSRVSSPSDAAAPLVRADQPASAPVGKQRKRRRGSARFAGMVEEEATSIVVPAEAAVPTPPAPSAATGRSPRGARFAGAVGHAEAVPETRADAPDAAARRETVEAVERLVRLRGEGRSGEAHALLVEFAYWPAPRIPLLAAELQRAGLGADWTTLLWEAASLPADRLVAAADALVAAGCAADAELILRQGVVRPADDIGEAVRDLAAEGRRREAGALLDAYVRVRTPEEAARSVAPDPKALVPLLLEAARGISDQHYWDLVHALRVAGLTA